MENALHRTLKELYAAGGAEIEATFGKYRVDVARGESVVEIQASPLGAIAAKVRDLTRRTAVHVIKPIVRRKHIVWLDDDGTPTSRRLSPKRGELIDVFLELVRFTRAFPHPNLTLELVLADIEELRVPVYRRRRWKPQFRVEDRRLVEVVSSQRLRVAADLWALLPACGSGPFTTAELAAWVGRSRWFAQAVAYTLRHAGAVRVVGKRGNSIMYEQTKDTESFRRAG